jgi:hypothetical protein
MAFLIGQFTATGASEPVPMQGDFNLSLGAGFIATLQLERRFVNDPAWFTLTYIDGTPLQWSAPLSTVLAEPEPGVAYRLRCVAFSSGPVRFRISQ